MKREQIQEILSNYNPKEIKIGVLGSHSALEMGHGAKQEGFEVVVVCQKGREKTCFHQCTSIKLLNMRLF